MHPKAPMTEQEKFEQQLQLEQELGRLAREVSIRISSKTKICTHDLFFPVHDHGKRS